MFKNKKLIAVNALVLAALLFGSTFIIVKNLLDDLSPTTVVFLRYLIASILFLISGGIPTKEYLKPCGAVYGRHSNPNSHYLFKGCLLYTSPSPRDRG